MKKMISLLSIIAVLMGCASLQARNKPQIFFTNEYGQDVAVALTWKNRNFPYSTQNGALNVKKGARNVMIKAPISTYDLQTVMVTPLKNLKQKNFESFITTSMSLSGAFAIGAAPGTMTSAGAVSLTPVGAVAVGVGAVVIGAAVLTDIIFDISTGENKHEIKNVHGNKYFVIEKEVKNSKVKGQKQIRTKGYKSEAHYNNEVVKQDNVVSAPVNELEQEEIQAAQAEVVMLVDVAPEELEEQSEQAQSPVTKLVESLVPDAALAHTSFMVE